MNCDDIFMTISNICAVFEDEVDVAERLDDHCFYICIYNIFKYLNLKTFSLFADISKNQGEVV